MFQFMKVLIFILKEGVGKSLLDILKISYNQKNQANFTNFCKRNSIISSTVLSAICKEFSLKGNSFYQFKQCHCPEGLNYELQNLSFPSSSALTTKHSDRHLLTVAPIIDLFICFEACCHVTSTKVNRNCHCSKIRILRIIICQRDGIQTYLLVPAV